MLKYGREPPNLTPEQAENFRSDMNRLFSKLKEYRIQDIEAGPFLKDAFSITRKYNVRLEGNFATLCLGTIILEGIGRQLDPNINLMVAALPFFLDRRVLSKADLLETFYKRYIEPTNNNPAN